ncbi:RNA 2',3'-cyclic phosphodiesterase [Alteromonas lipolytica]|uniref:RNA 2',3'-cyclic phosphodiesterase n=1 Tax=Alteromonas lipolytica TaxID=1856405 RepID=A0A1E8FBN5_9ALTE|nr:RNA 2',3'-cyclic phosphodiesterase [Alteromonas lipolytica]OFI33196.1 2'-5' RNA ligase [Alteromonas lipolytica]GGF61706.1 hypothetical protein GCM10011338_12520 [Alteromonas lipolytica]
MRYFIGLDLAPAEKLGLESWREKSLPELPRVKQPGNSKAPVRQARPVPVANFHITLCFLGSITARQLESISQCLDDIAVRPFSLELDSTGYWSGPKIFYAAPTIVPEPLQQLASATESAARRADIAVERRDYQPHVTLIRNVKEDFPPPLFLPAQQCQFNQFHLFESVSTKSGVTYPIRQSWKLRADNSVRERLLRGNL